MYFHASNRVIHRMKDIYFNKYIYIIDTKTFPLLKLFIN